MSKRILILTGSPRRDGNSDLMAEAFARGASEVGNRVMRFEAAHKHIQMVAGLVTNVSARITKPVFLTMTSMSWLP